MGMVEVCGNSSWLLCVGLAAAGVALAWKAVFLLALFLAIMKPKVVYYFIDVFKLEFLAKVAAQLFQ